MAETLDGLGQVGFIGGGMMAEATIRGLIAAGVAPGSIVVSDTASARLEYLSSEFGVGAAAGNADVAAKSDVVVLVVKPYVVPAVLAEIGSTLKNSQLLIVIAAGVTSASVESALSAEVPVVRVMPNTPCLIGQGASAISAGKYAERSHLDTALSIFGAIGKAVVVSESMMDAVTGLSGSGPAYVYTFIEALADGGVRMGLPRDVALELAAQTVVGSAMMVLESDSHPAQLRDRVTTPGGTTAAGTAALERNGFRWAAIEAVTDATLRAAELGKPK